MPKERVHSQSNGLWFQIYIYWKSINVLFSAGLVWEFKKIIFQLHTVNTCLRIRANSSVVLEASPENMKLILEITLTLKFTIVFKSLQ
jgi:hypothetical protein